MSGIVITHRVCMTCQEQTTKGGARLGAFVHTAHVAPVVSHGQCAACYVAGAQSDEELRQRLQDCLDILDGKLG